jgi:hypothetical protein
VRSNDVDVAARLRAVLVDHVVPDVEAPPNLSLLVGGTDGRIRDFHWLYRGGRATVRSRTIGRLVRAAVAHLDAYAPRPEHQVQLDARLLVREGVAVLVDPLLGSIVDRVERRLQRLGYQVGDVAAVSVDPDGFDVVLSAPTLDLDPDALDALERDSPREAVELGLGPAALPVQALLLWEPDREHPVSPAGRLVSVTRLLTSMRPDPVTLDELLLAVQLLGAWEIHSCPSEDEALLELARLLIGSS